MKKVFYKLQDNYVTQKSQDALLLGAEERKIGDTGGHQRDKLIENEEIAWNQFNKLENAKRTLAGTESISLNVMRDLHHQGNQMKNISVKISDMNQQMEDSSDLMVKMERRNRRIRIYIYVFSGVLALVGFIILLFKAFNI